MKSALFVDLTLMSVIKDNICVLSYLIQKVTRSTLVDQIFLAIIAIAKQ